MHVRISGLTSIKGVYYYRRRIPVGHQPHMGTRIIKYSLRTKDLNKAELACKFISTQIDKFLNSGIAFMLDKKVIDKKIAQYVHDSLYSSERHVASFGKICQATRDDQVNNYEYALKALKTKIVDNDLEITRPLAEELLSDLPTDECDVNYTARALLDALIFLTKAKSERLTEGETKKIFKADYAKILKNSTDESTQVIITQEVPTPAEVFKISDLFEEYKKEKMATGSWERKMEESVVNAVNLLIEYCGNRDIKSIRHRDLLDFRDNVLMKIPARWKKKPEFKNLTLLQVLKKTSLESQSASTVNTKLTKLMGFFLWCNRHDYIDKNPAENLRISVRTKPDEQRGLYGTEDLKKLLIALPKINAFKQYKYWIPLIGMYSGARQTEIAQLYVNDIVRVNDIPCFSFMKDGKDDKRIKTNSSYRIIPIHPVLLQLGFLDIVNEIRIQGHERMWIDLKNCRDGYGQRFQRFYGRFNREKITEDPRKVFHSFRHNVANCLKQAGEDESKIKGLLGHSDKSITFSRYGKAYRPDVLLNTLKKLDYEIDIFGLLGVVPQTDEEITTQIEQLPPLES